MIDLAIRPFHLYARFTGRASRREFWLFFLFQLLVNVLLVGALSYGAHHRPPGHMAGDMSLETVAGYVWIGYLLLSVVPFYAVVARRFRDLGQSGWMCLVLLVPMAGPAFVMLNMLRPGQPGDNLYGPAPLR
ncbi:uncharacterized membrane protein YhaH (DUF805 family) [Stenotrophomonas sp. AN71]|uniref:DUF805 domain-containing protein n=1 Tax=Stenotrophomonas sp. AN71 TaxID=3156253 RepID=UPI003D1982AD